MRIVLFAQAFAIFTAIAMIGVFVAPLLLAEYGTTNILFRFLQFEALALGMAIVATIAIPQLTGVQKGEKVLLITSDPVSNRMTIKIATALENAKLNKEIKIDLGDVVATGTVESYSGIISPARINIKPEQNIKVI
ncbi:MAG: hypothetical protein ABIH83_00015 [Candidatus Micrarchaeota archaeon]